MTQVLQVVYHTNEKHTDELQFSASSHSIVHGHNIRYYCEFVKGYMSQN